VQSVDNEEARTARRLATALTNKLVVDGLLHEDTRAGDAALAAIEEQTKLGDGDGL
jgi:hypothetical protein